MSPQLVTSPLRSDRLAARRILVGLLWASMVAGWICPNALLSQPATGTPGQDPLMALMLSQPRIDVDSPVVPAASFDPPVVRPGEEAIYRVTLNALETSIQLPEKLNTFPPTDLRASAHGQLLVLTGTNYQPRTTFNFRLRAPQSGQLTVPPFVADVYGKKVTVPLAQLEVLADLPPVVLPAQTLKLDLPRTNLYVGQAVRASVTLPPSSSLVMQHSSPLQINGQGFIIDPSTLRPRVDNRRPGPGNTVSIAYDLVLTPIGSGKLTAFAQAFVGTRMGAASMVFAPGVGEAGSAQYTLVDSDTVEVQVMPLPREGQLPGFTGAVGTFVTDPPQPATNVLHVGEPVKITVRVRGEGNLLRLVPPEPPRVDQWRVYAGEANATHPQIIQAQGFTVFNYVIVPLSEQCRATPPIPFSVFDPTEGRYRDCTIQPVPVIVLPGMAPADPEIVAQADAAGGSAEKEPVLSGLAASPGLAATSLIPVQRRGWFPFVQLAPAVAFAGLWGWDRRRRFCEAHPDVVLRRRARRELRRQWRAVRKAAARRDGTDFAAAAVRALDVACSPFYPADPRALVGSDVLALLPEQERFGPRGQTIRELFDASDAARFSTQRQDSDRLLRLEPEVNSLLSQLEERLRA